MGHLQFRHVSASAETWMENELGSKHRIGPYRSRLGLSTLVVQ